MSSTITRRTVTAGLAALPVAGAAMLADKALPAEPAGGFSWTAVLARFERIIATLSDCYIAKGWKLDHESAERARRYVVAKIESDGGPDDEEDDVEGLENFVAFFREHRQCLDYAFMGNETGMFAMLASHSPRAARCAAPLPDPIYAAIEAHAAVQADLDRFCARLEADERPGDEDTLAVLCDEETKLLWGILVTEPTTIAGVAAALAHMDAYRRHGHEMPDRPLEPETDLEPPARRFEWGDMHVDFEQDAIAWAARHLQRLGGVNA